MIVCLRVLIKLAYEASGKLQEVSELLCFTIQELYQVYKRVNVVQNYMFMRYKVIFDFTTLREWLNRHKQFYDGLCKVKQAKTTAEDVLQLILQVLAEKNLNEHHLQSLWSKIRLWQAPPATLMLIIRNFHSWKALKSSYHSYETFVKCNCSVAVHSKLFT